MRIVLPLLSFMVIAMHVRAQYVYTIKADSVKITNTCDSAELIIQNHTQGVTGGFLYNTWNGRTIFKKALQKINDSLYLIGPDSLKVLAPEIVNTGIPGYNVDFLYGNGSTGIPIKGGDSTYTDGNLAGRHLMIYFNGPSSSSFVQDSVTWALLGSNYAIPYYRFISSLGKVVFCNMQNISGLMNGKFVVSIFGGDQGYYSTVIVNNAPVPTLALSPASLTGFTTTAGIQSAAQSFTITAYNLTGNATVTAPANYLVSLSSGSGYAGSIPVPETGGNIAGTTVYVVISSSASAGSPSGNITVSATGVTTQNIAVSGTVNGTPSLSVSPASLSGFSTTTGTQSASQTFTVTGSNLTANATVTAPANYVVSLLPGTGYASSATVPQSGGSITGTPVYIALASTAAVGSPSGNATVASAGAATQDVAVSGTVSGIPALTVSPSSLIGFSTTAGTQSSSQTFTVIGSNLTANATVTAPTGYVVSLTSGSGYGGSVSVTESGGTISGTTVYAAIASTTGTGTVSGNITVGSTAATTQDVAVSGTVSSGTTAMDSIRVQFVDSTGDITQTGFKQLEGDIATAAGNISVTGGNSNSITVTAIKSGWLPGNPTNFGATTAGLYACSYSGFSINATDTLFPYARNAMSGFWYNSVNNTTPIGVNEGTAAACIEISGLQPGHNYSLEISGATTSLCFNNILNSQATNYYAGSSLTSIQTGTNNAVPMCNQSYPGTPTNSSVMGVFNSANGNELTADSSGNLYIWTIADDNKSIAGVSAFILTQLN